LRDNEILGQYKNDCHDNHEYGDHEKQRNAGKHQTHNVLFGIVEPSCGEGEARWNSGQHEQHAQRHQRVKQLPEEIAPSRLLPAIPALADVAFFCQDAVEQDEAHDAADVHENNPENERSQDDNDDQSSEQRRIHAGEIGPEKMLRAAGMLGNIEVREVRCITSAAGAEFAGQQAHDGEPYPLTDAKRLQELPLGVLDGRRDRVYG
jgi:hypothetical protein